MSQQQVHAASAAAISAGAVLTAALAGGRAGPQQPRAGLWYATLKKPSYTPPGPAIGVVWMVLYGLLGFAGYRLTRAAPSARRTTALAGWAATLAGIALFPHTFFRRRNLVESEAVVGGMLASSFTAAAAAYKIDRTAAVAIAPVVVWVAFAGVLNTSLWRRN